MVFMWRYGEHVNIFIKVMLVLPQSIQPHCVILVCLYICVGKTTIFSFNDVAPANSVLEFVLLKLN